MFQILIRNPCLAVFASGPHKFISRILPTKQHSLRSFLFSISIYSLSYVRPLLGSALLTWLTLWLAGPASWSSRFFEEGDLVFLLADNSLTGVFFGMLCGGLMTLIGRRVWLSLLVAMLLLIKGNLALNVAWGWWMGIGLGFWLHQNFIYRGDSFVKRALRWRFLVYLIALLVVFYFSDSLVFLLRSASLTHGFLPGHFERWLMAGGITFGIDMLLALIFFHFYYQQIDEPGSSS